MRSLVWAVIDQMYKHCSPRILVDGHESDDYAVEYGLHKRSVLGPILYAIFVDEMVNETGTARYGVAVGYRHVKVLVYANDVVIISDNAKITAKRA